MSESHARRGVVIGVVIAAVVALAAAAAVVWMNRGAEEVDTAEVIERFREEGGPDAPTDDTALPTAGVYEYSATGTEKLSLLDTSQQWGPTMPVTITHDGEGCFTQRFDFSTNHWQSQRFCPTSDKLQETSGWVFQKFDFGVAITDNIEFTCTDAFPVHFDAEVGDTWDSGCTGTSTERGTQVRSEGPNTFLGRETLDIGGEEVEVLHYRVERTLSIDQSGTETTENYYDARTGMILKSHRMTSVTSPSPIGDVLYTEDGTFEATSIVPTT